MKLTMCIQFLFLFPLFAFSQGQIKFSTLEYNLPPVSIGQTTTLKIPFSNIGKEPLLITKCQSSNATSTIEHHKKPILPNQSDTLNVKILNNAVGNFRHSFTVAVNNQENENVIKVNINVFDLKVYGKVLNKNNGEPLPFATVKIDKNTRGTTTDFGGKYYLNASSNDTLVFSLAGMKTRKVKVDREEVNIQLEEIERIKEVEPPITQNKVSDYSVKTIPDNEILKEKKVIGKIIEKATNELIFGAIIKNKKTDTETFSDVYGKFEITASFNDILVVNFFGLSEKEIKVTDNNYYEIYLEK
ncbi:carboxypeptidase-like regulatory domain-containing protein [Flavobacterium sp.]|uniref:carboxypeptidase-like regulatory domain-containing protein n=1 Tax=Flavobacterium sp. TaxID=239 RepID=UPI003F69969E